MSETKNVTQVSLKILSRFLHMRNPTRWMDNLQRSGGVAFFAFLQERQTFLKLDPKFIETMPPTPIPHCRYY